MCWLPSPTLRLLTCKCRIGSIIQWVTSTRQWLGGLPLAHSDGTRKASSVQTLHRNLKRPRSLSPTTSRNQNAATVRQPYAFHHGT
jgi:hypothetical protein